MKKFLHIKSIVPANISINGEHLFSSNVDIISNTNFFIAFFPKNKSLYPPCAISLRDNSSLSSIKKIPYNNNHFEIIYNPSTTYSKEKETIILNKKFNNTIFTITNTNKSYINITSSTFNHNTIINTIKSVDFKTYEEFAILNGIINEDNIYLLIYNTKSKSIILEDTFKIVEKTKNEIKALKSENSLAGYGRIFEFNYTSKKINEYNVYLNTLPLTTDTPELIPFFFLESIKYKDLKTAKKYLENNNIDNNYLNNFFGQIKDIYFNGYAKEINYTIETSLGFKNFTFLIENNKITDIEENQLNCL